MLLEKFLITIKLIVYIMLDWQYSKYSEINPQAKSNFPFAKPRPDQLETISEILKAIDDGYRYIVLEAGTGTGKSAIAATLANIADSSYILTVTKQLQDQYLKDFNEFKVVKGRSNFKCRQYPGHACDEGKCILEGYNC
jgi:Rad3-related DNA helicase